MRRPFTRRGTVALLAAFVLLGIVASQRSAHGGELRPVDEVSAKRELDKARTGWKSKDPAVRALATEAVAGLDHPLVARELLVRLRKEVELGALERVVRALGRQQASAPDVGKKLLAFLAAAAEVERKREVSGSPGFPLDPRSGEPAIDTKEGRDALLAMEARSRVNVAAIQAIRSLAVPIGSAAAAWSAFLQDPSDELVVEALDGLAAGKCSDALPAILDLYRMYPLPNTWETGAVIDLSGTNASAKARWMVRFGHPDKRKARPKVVEGIGKALLAITGRSFDSPEALHAWLSRPGKPSRAMHR